MLTELEFSVLVGVMSVLGLVVFVVLVVAAADLLIHAIGVLIMRALKGKDGQ